MPNLTELSLFVKGSWFERASSHAALEWSMPKLEKLQLLNEMAALPRLRAPNLRDILFDDNHWSELLPLLRNGLPKLRTLGEIWSIRFSDGDDPIQVPAEVEKLIAADSFRELEVFRCGRQFTGLSSLTSCNVQIR